MPRYAWGDDLSSTQIAVGVESGSLLPCFSRKATEHLKAVVLRRDADEAPIREAISLRLGAIVELYRDKRDLAR